jgi:CheY-like chemotaxis protein
MTETATVKILVVDDEPDIVEMLQSLLEIEGYRVLTALDGEQALAALAEGPALILLDIMMPSMDGHAVLRAIRSMPGPVSAVPVVIVTARNDVLDIGRSLDEGVNGFVVKPFDTDQLVRTVKSVLSRNPVPFYANYDRVAGVTSRSGSGYQQGDRIIFLDLHETDPGSDEILEALNQSGVHLMSILQFDAQQGRRQSSVLLTAEDGIAFGAFLNTLLRSGNIGVGACQIYKDQMDLPQDLFSAGQDYSLE